jgi:hypothetical protein
MGFVSRALQNVRENDIANDRRIGNFWLPQFAGSRHRLPCKLREPTGGAASGEDSASAPRASPIGMRSGRCRSEERARSGSDAASSSMRSEKRLK